MTVLNSHIYIRSLSLFLGQHPYVGKGPHKVTTKLPDDKTVVYFTVQRTNSLNFSINLFLDPFNIVSL